MPSFNFESGPESGSGSVGRWTYWLLQHVCPQVGIQQVLCLVSNGLVTYERGRVESLHALQLCEVGLLEVFILHRVYVGVSVVVPVF